MAILVKTQVQEVVAMLELVLVQYQLFGQLFDQLFNQLFSQLFGLLEAPQLLHLNHKWQAPGQHGVHGESVRRPADRVPEPKRDFANLDLIMRYIEYYY